MASKILVVDDEKDILELLKYNLERAGYFVLTASNGIEALEKLNFNPDLIILDLMMPVLSGFETFKKIKSFDEYKHVPIMFLTAKTNEADEIYGLNLGASDYIQKPISISKLIARIESNLRRDLANSNNLSSGSVIKIGGLVINKENFEVSLNDKEIILSKKEYDILVMLVSNIGKVFNRAKLLSSVWGDDVLVTERTVDVHILNIRKKMGDNFNSIETLKGVGYRYKNN